ncbi:hypothetical protein F3Y22_tig00110569pilonHSYRG00181 [Hibiscus syriacus]|uniref:Uncharacterized protein n=1 Tax=Hibiscus syriacus TaxID=106335 RepID=A0A6A3A9R9_HIBSY|nr:hypothetical protein F3Y22_tig00110569pilonHSYRG00181 [Hibiscus syriacus]
MESGNMSGVHDTGSDLNLDQDATPSESPQISVDKKPTDPSHSSSSGGHLGECSLVSSISVNRQPSDDDLATPVPRTPSEEQPTEDSERTPSHVFARTTTAATREWSLRSNESLFSLHTGNMSFTAEQLNLMSKSGEFCYGCDSALSSPLPPGTPWDNMSATEFARHGGNLNSDSLFSIRTGNTSFTSDHMNLTSKSGELNIDFDPTNSGRLLDAPCKDQTAAEISEGCDGKSEAEAAETEKEKEPRVRKHSVNKELSLYASRIRSSRIPAPRGKRAMLIKSQLMQVSNLLPSLYKNRSTTQSTEEQNQQSQCSTTETPETLSEEANKTETTPETANETEATTETSKLGSPKETTQESPSGTTKPQTPNATRNGEPKKWYACFSCCTASATS